jgi:hypothetical protein
VSPVDALLPLVKPRDAAAPVAAAPTALAALAAAVFASSTLVGTAALTFSIVVASLYVLSLGKPASLPPLMLLATGFELIAEEGAVRESSNREGVAPFAPFKKPEAEGVAVAMLVSFPSVVDWLYVSSAPPEFGDRYAHLIFCSCRMPSLPDLTSASTVAH